MNEQFLTSEQRYASAVYTVVTKYLNERLSNSNDEIKKDPSKDVEIKAYGALAHKLPILIRTSGLAQALAFVKARNVINVDDEDKTQQDKNAKHNPKKARNRLINDLTKVLQNKHIAIIPINTKEKDLSSLAIQATFDEYIQLTEACMEALLWFKRFATSELGVEQGDEVEGE